MKLEIRAECAECGATLCEKDYDADPAARITLSLIPCEHCLEEARENGDQEKDQS